MKMKIEALLLILAALQQDHTAAAERLIYPLDMALNSVDDQYKGCTEKMAAQVKTDYLKKELQNSNDFKKVWQSGKKYIKHRKKKSSLDILHELAMYAYTYPGNNETPKIFNKFNEDTRKGKENYRANTYNWYSLHFLLTDAIHILKNKQNKCFETFRGTNVTFNGQAFTSVRFGSFTSSSIYDDVAEKFGKLSCFEIQTCEGAYIAMYSMDHDEGEVLIPPYEVFNITRIKTKNEQNDLWCDTVYVLNSTGVKSDLNCVAI
ncbi:NAD(P)(+)--arginine ADP-ribosyltransferase 2-like [Danio aesculapii]|uniref:NAD(P)(+)--arginine ADP-ribosyltransferase 2-like n=1 Tax=Danio aesculapii TaxID=1142201 RepID=UPI0024BF8FDB|nr:NAD(P)(+)--arginine ADP-ribosyltransferase 2-like [Danio aesculapii]